MFPPNNGGEGKLMDFFNVYQNNYLVVTAFILIGVLLPMVALTAGRLLRPHNPYEAKRITYESGIDPVGDSWVRFNVRYYVIALLFVLFDVEAVFIIPWAVAYEKLGFFALIEMLIFVIFLLLGLVYAWKKKVLKWI